MSDKEWEGPLARLKQLALEERRAVANRDEEALLRIAQLLPAATSRVLGCPPPLTTDSLNAIREILESNDAAERFMNDRMSAAASALCRISKARPAKRAYSRKPRGIRRLGDIEV